MFEVKTSQQVDKSLLQQIQLQKSQELSSLKQAKQQLFYLFKTSKNQKHIKKIQKITQKIHKLKQNKTELSLPTLSTLTPQVRPQQNPDFHSLGSILVPIHYWTKLLTHQQAALQWLWNLHQKNCGGILADDMGLGKTIEVISLLQVLNYNNLLKGPVLILSPTTIIGQWIQQFQEWSSLQVYNWRENRSSLQQAFNRSGVLISSYQLLHTTSQKIINRNWFYLILDEGHKIKNPQAKITKIVKKLRSKHKLLISGTPIQNSLTQLWSLFDFVQKGLLGNQEVFQTEFGSHIAQAGYSNSSSFQVQLGYQCALKIRQLIRPFILRRTKKQVNLQIPQFQQKILFCQFSYSQWEEYCKYIRQNIQITQLSQKKVFRQIKDLRLIANHPKLLKSTLPNQKTELSSGKFKVLSQILQLWKQEQRSVAIFSQFKKILSITEEYLQQYSIVYGRIDGSVCVQQRLNLIQLFNQGKLQILLLTTRVGGFGINLPKASRIVILDPDWNPMNDFQAKQRALRIGQNSNVVIYRLITKNSIEQKIYNKQVFKIFLANKVNFIQILKAASQKVFSSKTSCADLFQIPPAPKEQIQIQSEFLPQKRFRQTDLLKKILDAQQFQVDIGNRDWNQVYRMKVQAKQIAEKATMSLRPDKLTRKVQNTNQSEKPHILIARSLLKYFYRYPQPTTQQVLHYIQTNLQDHDKYLVREILQKIASLSSNKWVLKSQFKLRKIFQQYCLIDKFWYFCNQMAQTFLLARQSTIIKSLIKEKRKISQVQGRVLRHIYHIKRFFQLQQTERRDFIQAIKPVLNKLKFFQTLQKQHSGHVFQQCLLHCQYQFKQSDSVIIKYGEIGDKFYILLAGKVKILKPALDGSMQQSLVLGFGQSFGQRALMLNQPRMATVQTLSPCHFAVMGIQNYKKVLDQRVKKEFKILVNLLKVFPSLQNMPINKLHKISYKFTKKEYKPKEPVYLQGEAVNKVHIILSGQVRISKLTTVRKKVSKKFPKVTCLNSKKFTQNMPIASLGHGSIIGDQQIIQGQKLRKSSCICFKETVLYTISKQSYLRHILVGQYAQTMKQRVMVKLRNRKRMAKSSSDILKLKKGIKSINYLQGKQQEKPVRRNIGSSYLSISLRGFLSSSKKMVRNQVSQKNSSSRILLKKEIDYLYPNSSQQKYRQHTSGLRIRSYDFSLE